MLKHERPTQTTAARCSRFSLRFELTLQSRSQAGSSMNNALKPLQTGLKKLKNPVNPAHPVNPVLKPPNASFGLYAGASASAFYPVLQLPTPIVTATCRHFLWDTRPSMLTNQEHGKGLGIRASAPFPFSLLPFPSPTAASHGSCERPRDPDDRQTQCDRSSARCPWAWS